MRSGTWLALGMGVGICIGMLLAGATGGCAKRGQESTEARKTEPPEREIPNRETPDEAAPIAPPPHLAEEKRGRACLGCQQLAQAIEAYVVSPANPGITEEDKLPQTLRDLYEAPFGGPSFLRNGKEDTIDPWGKSFDSNVTQRKDGTTYLLVRTTSPDGTPISQFGIGPAATPKH